MSRSKPDALGSAILRPAAATALLVAVIALPTGSLSAGLIKSLEFDVDGVLPSSDPDIIFHQDPGVVETDLYSVSGGLLRQRVFGSSVNANPSYHSPDFDSTAGTFDSSQFIAMEARLRVLNLNASLPYAPLYFSIGDGDYRYLASFYATGIGVLTNSGYAITPVDVSEFHTYRLESAGNSSEVRLFIDDALAFTGTAITSALNHYAFGDGSSVAGQHADADWDFIRVYQGSLTAVPEPSSLALMSMGALSLFGRRRRRNSLRTTRADA